MNRHLKTVIVAPMTTGGKSYPTRIAVEFEEKSGRVALDQLRTVDSQRLLRRLGCLNRSESNNLLTGLQSMFAP